MRKQVYQLTGLDAKTWPAKAPGEQEVDPTNALYGAEPSGSLLLQRLSAAQRGFVVPLGFWMFIKQAASCLPATWVRLCGKSALLEAGWADRAWHSQPDSLLVSYMEHFPRLGRETQTTNSGPGGRWGGGQDYTAISLWGSQRASPKASQGFHPPLSPLGCIPLLFCPLAFRSLETWQHLAQAWHKVGSLHLSRTLSACRCLGRPRDWAVRLEQVLFLLWVQLTSKNFGAETKLLLLMWGESDLCWRTWQGLPCFWGESDGVHAPWSWHSGNVACQLWGWGSVPALWSLCY